MSSNGDPTPSNTLADRATKPLYTLRGFPVSATSGVVKKGALCGLLFFVSLSPASGADLPFPGETGGTGTRIVVQDVSPGLDPKSVAARPKSIWRLGSDSARIEEWDGTRTGTHLLVILHQQDAWLVDLVTHTARHTVDPEPAPRVRVSIVPDASTPELRALEFGRESDFLRAGHPTKGAATEVRGRICHRETLVVPEARVEIEVDPKTKTPCRVSVDRGGKKTVLEYLSYDEHFAMPKGFFELPAGIRVKESEGASP